MKKEKRKIRCIFFVLFIILVLIEQGGRAVSVKAKKNVEVKKEKYFDKRTFGQRR